MYKRSTISNLNNNRIIESINNELIQECKSSVAGDPGACLSDGLRKKLENSSKEIRKEIVKITRDGVSPLFIACKRGNVKIIEYLVTVCGADLEQKGMYEVPDDRSHHCVTPLWCAAVSGKLLVVECLVRLGSDVNALSDTGSTPVRSACFMTHIEIIVYLVEHGADIKKPNYNGGTCLINSVQSSRLCLYLISRGADVNARDIQDKTALHYAIHEHRFETTKLLLENGADPYIKSRYGDDALQTACLKAAHQIFDYLKNTITYSNERLANAHELIGSTYLDEYNETRVAILHWRLAHHIRLKGATYIAKEPAVPRRPAYLNATEFATIYELDDIAANVDAMRIQSLLICERVLGINHKDTLFRLMFRGASYADSLCFQRCIDLWRLALQIRVNRHSILYSDTCFTTQALVKLMLDLQDKYVSVLPNGFIDFDVPRFDDIFGVFVVLTKNIIESRKLLRYKPVHRKQQENFDKILKCVTHLIYLLVVTEKTDYEMQMLTTNVEILIASNVRSAFTNDTILHLCVSSLNVIKSTYFSDENNLKVVFPNVEVVKFLLKCGANVNGKNESKSIPLHVALMPYNYDEEIVRTLLDNGAHIDQPNRADDRPINLVAINSNNVIPLMNYTTLKCLAATVIAKYKIPFRNQVPKTLEVFIQLHLP